MTASVNWHHLAWWCLPLLVLASAWHLRATLRGHPLPGRWARVGLALIITTGVLLSYRTLNGLTAGATLLTAMTAAKLFEARATRDWYVIIAATLFLLLAACLDRQQLWRLPTYALCVCGSMPPRCAACRVAQCRRRRRCCGNQPGSCSTRCRSRSCCFSSFRDCRALSGPCLMPTRP